MTASARIALSFLLSAPLALAAQATPPLVVTTHVDGTDRPTFSINKSAYVAVFEVTHYDVRVIFPVATDSCGQRLDPGLREIPAQFGRKAAPSTAAPWLRFRYASHRTVADPARSFAYLVIAATSPLNFSSPGDAQRKIGLAFADRADDGPLSLVDRLAVVSRAMMTRDSRADLATDQFFTTGRISAPFSHFAGEEEQVTVRPLSSSASPLNRSGSWLRLRRAI